MGMEMEIEVGKSDLIFLFAIYLAIRSNEIEQERAVKSSSQPEAPKRRNPAFIIVCIYIVPRNGSSKTKSNQTKSKFSIILLTPFHFSKSLCFAPRRRRTIRSPKNGKDGKTKARDKPHPTPHAFVSHLPSSRGHTRHGLAALKVLL